MANFYSARFIVLFIVLLAFLVTSIFLSDFIHRSSNFSNASRQTGDFSGFKSGVLRPKLYFDTELVGDTFKTKSSNPLILSDWLTEQGAALFEHESTRPANIVFSEKRLFFILSIASDNLEEKFWLILCAIPNADWQFELQGQKISVNFTRGGNLNLIKSTEVQFPVDLLDLMVSYNEKWKESHFVGLVVEGSYDDILLNNQSIEMTWQGNSDILIVNDTIIQDIKMFRR